MKRSLWDRFNTWIDPKLGWHVFWIFPLCVLMVAANRILEARDAVAKKLRRLTPEQKRLQELAGVAPPNERTGSSARGK